jgi:hypothetical protein
MLLDLDNDELDLLECDLFDSDEEYFPDERVDLRPSEIVESKLIGMLPKGMAIPVSCVHTRRDVRRFPVAK